MIWIVFVLACDLTIKEKKRNDTVLTLYPPIFFLLLTSFKLQTKKKKKELFMILSLWCHEVIVELGFFIQLRSK